MATFGATNSSLTDITIPELVGIPSKRKSLGQLKGALYRQVCLNFPTPTPPLGGRREILRFL